MKKALIWTFVIVLFDIAIGTLAVEYFDLIAFAQKYNQEIVHSMFAGIVVWSVYKFHKKYRFIDVKNQVKIQLLEDK